jgi:hypothetical protein
LLIWWPYGPSCTATNWSSKAEGGSSGSCWTTGTVFRVYSSGPLSLVVIAILLLIYVSRNTSFCINFSFPCSLFLLWVCVYMSCGISQTVYFSKT